jgi:colanic acid/amylovoran biosynthesis glycosyltransferase
VLKRQSPIDSPIISSDARPVVACYCATFLKPEMLHIYRQIVALERFRPVVIARKREEAERFPFAPIVLARKSRLHFLRRIWFRNIRSAPWQISASETRGLIAQLSAIDARLLHVYFGHIAVHLLPLIRTWPRPTVVSFHGADVLVDMEKPAYRRATNEMLGAARLVLTRSESLARALENLGCAPEKIRIHRTGIPLDEIAFRERTRPAQGQWRLLQACRLIEKKGLATTLRAFAKFAEIYPEASLTIAGDGPMRGELEQLVHELSVGARVTFTGFVSQERMRELFYDSHLFLHPSETGADGNQEGVPNSMLEAMASGLPVFATRHGGIPEAIDSGVSGVLVDERDHEGLARSLLDLTARPDELSLLARRGAEIVREKFEQQAQARKLEDYYFEALA